MSTREEKNRDIQKEIENDELREKRKKITIIFFKTIFITVFLFSSFYFYTKYISTNSIIVKEKRLVEKNLPQSFNGIKIIQFSDIHYTTKSDLENLKKTIKLINKRNPDVVIFTGDLIEKDSNITTKESELIIKQLSQISASIGKYAVTGDQDEESFTTIMKQSDFTILDNNYDFIYNNTNEPILIVGLSSIKQQRNIEKAFEYTKKDNNLNNIYTLLVLHEADSIDEILNNYHVNIALAGHSLNGQICLTKNLCFIKKENSTKYYKEFYKLNDTKLFISSGIGSPYPNFRIMARPSINFFRLALE